MNRNDDKHNSIGEKITNFISENKIVLVILVTVLALIFFSSGKQGVTGNNNTLDNSNKMTTSSDTITDNAIKMGDIGEIKGDLIISKEKE